MWLAHYLPARGFVACASPRVTDNVNNTTVVFDHGCQRTILWTMAVLRLPQPLSLDFTVIFSEPHVELLHRV